MTLADSTAPTGVAVKTSVVNIRKVRGVSPEYDVYIGRGAFWVHLPNSVWRNPFPFGGLHTREQVIDLYRHYIVKRLEGEPRLRVGLKNLTGKRLGCWCAPEPCHGDVLAELADALGQDR